MFPLSLVGSLVGMRHIRRLGLPLALKLSKARMVLLPVPLTTDVALEFGREVVLNLLAEMSWPRGAVLLVGRVEVGVAISRLLIASLAISGSLSYMLVNLVASMNGIVI